MPVLDQARITQGLLGNAEICGESLLWQRRNLKKLNPEYFSVTITSGRSTFHMLL